MVFDSKKVTDHHGIIPTVSSLSEDLSGITESEAKVYRIISNKLHASVGDILSIEKKEIKEKFTQPPKHFTEDTLLKSMEIAGNDALEKGVEVERKGLGTPATDYSGILGATCPGFWSHRSGKREPQIPVFVSHFRTLFIRKFPLYCMYTPRCEYR